MARTVRRKNCYLKKYHVAWWIKPWPGETEPRISVVKTQVFSDLGEFVRYDRRVMTDNEIKKTLKRKEAEFHSDSGRWGVPRSYRKIFTRELRSQFDQYCYRCSVDEDYADAVCPPTFVYDAAWYYY